MSTVNLLEEVTGEKRNQLYFSPPSKLAGDGKPQDFLIFMITGNPGLISYYHPFLSTLYSRLLSSSKVPRNSRFYIYGHSMKGFDASKSEYENVSTFPVGLAGQIEDIENLLFEQLRQHRKVESVPPKVILMGHSVGAYILLELIRQHRKRIDGGEEDFDLIGGILLFPTITHIAKSPQGMMYDVSTHLRHTI